MGLPTEDFYLGPPSIVIKEGTSSSSRNGSGSRGTNYQLLEQRERVEPARGSALSVMHAELDNQLRKQVANKPRERESDYRNPTGVSPQPRQIIKEPEISYEAELAAVRNYKIAAAQKLEFYESYYIPKVLIKFTSNEAINASNGPSEGRRHGLSTASSLIYPLRSAEATPLRDHEPASSRRTLKHKHNGPKSARRLRNLLANAPLPDAHLDLIISPARLSCTNLPREYFVGRGRNFAKHSRVAHVRLIRVPPNPVSPERYGRPDRTMNTSMAKSIFYRTGPFSLVRAGPVGLYGENGTINVFMLLPRPGAPTTVSIKISNVSRISLRGRVVNEES
ncbi:hypothetical protein EVAR_70961_1 [Eumeta japonica]|uniref:Uncharacterized protein n=1 Tax=Eumeta variegata TaxID=151549 RepID=A0A4C1SGX5_EUMVA|nr:hypothetical protein EVAR_70961_1 [Eumeta japonica]